MFNWNNKKSSSPSGGTNVSSSPTTSLTGLGPLGQTGSSGNLSSTLSSISSGSGTSSNSSGSLGSLMESSASTTANSNAAGNSIFSQPIQPNQENGPVLLSKLTKYLMSKPIPDNIFKPHPEIDSEVQTVKKNLLKDLSLGDAEQLNLTTLTQNSLVIGEILKQYLFSLPEPLFSYNLYDSFLLTHTILTPTDRIWAYRFLLLYLPIGFRGAIKNIVGLLQKIHNSSSTTRMDSVALSSILAPVFLRPEEEMYYMKSDKSTIEEILRLWIEEFETITKPQVGQNPKVSTILSSMISTPPPSNLVTPTPVSNPTSSGGVTSPLHTPLMSSSNESVSQTSQSATPTSSSPGHLTIGLNKIFTNATNPQQSPKLALPTLPKQQNSQLTTVIKVKTPLQAKPAAAAASPNTSSNNLPTATASASSTTPSPAVPPTATTKPSPSPSPSSTTPTITSTPSMITGTKQPKAFTPPVLNKNSPMNTSISQLLPPSTSSPLSGSNGIPMSNYTLLTSLDSETTDKVSKIKNTVDSLLSDQILNNLRSISKSIDKEINYNNTIKFSTILRDFKKGIMESSEKTLQISKSDVKTLVSLSPRPQGFIIQLSSISNGFTVTEDEKRLLELKRASQLAIDEITEYIYFFKVKLQQFIYKEQIIQTAQLFSRIKSIIDVNGTTGTGGLTDSTGISVSPSQSPVTSRKSVGSSGSISTVNASSNPTFRVIEVCTSEIVEKLNSIKKQLDSSNLQDTIEIGKAMRTTKQTLQELFQENKYPIPPDSKVQTSPENDQLKNLKLAIEPIFERSFNQVDYILRLVINNTSRHQIPEQEINNCSDKLLFINKVLSTTITTSP